MSKIRTWIVVTAVFAWIAAYGGDSDVYLKMKIQQPDAKGKNQTEQIQETWVTSSKVRTNSGDQSSILDVEKNVFITIDHAKKKYMEIPLNFSGSSVSDEQQNMTNLPSFMQNMMKMEVTVRPANEEKEINGWHCRKYFQTLKMSMGTSESEIWASEDIHINADVYRKFNAALMASQPGFYKLLKDMMKESEKIKGVTVFQKTTGKMMGKNYESTTELIEVEKVTASPDLFTVPAGYKQEKFKES